MPGPRLLFSFGLPTLGLLLCTAGWPLVQAAPPAPAAGKAAGATAARDGVASGEYVVDGVHSTVIFRIKHAQASWSYGRFNELSGSFTVDAEHPEKSFIELTVQASSVDTANAKRDQHLRSPDFFNTEEFPELHFISHKVKPGKDGALDVSGELTLHGVSKPLAVTVEFVGGGPALGGGGGRVAGYETVFTVKRSDFGMDYGQGALGDDVRIIVSVEGHQGG